MLIGFVDEPGIAMVAMSDQENDGDQHPIVKAKLSFHMTEKNEGYALITFITLVKDENVSDDILKLANGYKVHIMRELSSIFVGSKLRYDIDGKHYHFVKKLGEKENLLIPVYEETEKKEEETTTTDKETETEETAETVTETNNTETEEMTTEAGDTPPMEEAPTETPEMETVEAEDAGTATEPNNFSNENVEEAVVEEETTE